VGHANLPSVRVQLGKRIEADRRDAEEGGVGAGAAAGVDLASTRQEERPRRWLAMWRGPKTVRQLPALRGRGLEPALYEKPRPASAGAGRGQSKIIAMCAASRRRPARGRSIIARSGESEVVRQVGGNDRILLRIMI